MKAIRQSRYFFLILFVAIALAFALFTGKLIFSLIMVGAFAYAYFPATGKAIQDITKHDLQILIGIFAVTFLLAFIFQPYFLKGFLAQGIWLCVTYEIGILLHKAKR